MEPTAIQPSSVNPEARVSNDRVNWMRSKWLQAAAIAALSLALNLAGNHRISLWDRDEPRYAGCAREMRISGDYVNPTFNAEPRYHKPVLVYWIMQVGVWIGGDNTFGNRLVSALAGMGTCLVIWGMGRRMFGARAGLIAALALATAPMPVIESKLATTDATLFFFLALSWWAMWELCTRPSRRWAGLFWVAMALAVLTKGPVGPLFLTVSTVVSWLWRGPRAALGRLHWRWGVPLFLLIAAPWYVAIGIISRGEFFNVAMGKHVITRMTTDLETHGGFPGFYVVGTLVGMFPWSALLPAALWSAWKRRSENKALGFAVGWWLGPLVVLELIRTKLIHYFLPACGGAALCVGWFLDAVIVSQVNLRRWPLGRLSFGLLVGIGLTVATAFAAGVFVVPGALRVPSAVLGLVIGVGTVLAAEPLLRSSTLRATRWLAATWALALFVLGAWVLPSAESFRLTPKVAASLKRVCTLDNATPVLASFQPPSLVYQFGKPIPVRQDGAWLAELARRERAVAVALTEKEIKIMERDPRLVLSVRERLTGFNIERGRDETVHITILQPSAVYDAIAKGAGTDARTQ